MKRTMLVILGFISVVVFLYLGNHIYEIKLEETIKSNVMEYIEE